MNNSLAGRTAIIATTEAIQAMHLQKVLRRAGLQVLDIVTKEREMLLSVESRRPDFLLLDVSVVAGAADAALRRPLQALNPCLILLSTLPEKQSRSLVEAWGAQSYLAKPVSHDEIIARLSEAWRPG